MSGEVRFNRALTVLVAVMAIMLLSIGCSKSPVESSTEPSEPHLLQRTAVSFLQMQSIFGSSGDSALYVEQKINAETGGVIQFYDVVLVIPPNALDNDTLFSINIPDLNVFYNEFGTSGLVFNQPVHVTMSYRDADLSNIDEETIRIAYYNEATGTFEDVICELDTVNKVVTAELNHFSAYGLISDFRIDIGF